MEEAFLFVFTRIASTEGFIALSALAALAFAARRRFREGLTVALGALALMLLTVLFKEGFQVARPEQALVEATGYAFPSGHASGVAFLALLLAFLSRKLPARLRYAAYAACLLFALAVGASRLYLGVHTPLQVAAGFALGALCALAAIFFLRRYR